MRSHPARHSAGLDLLQFVPPSDPDPERISYAVSRESDGTVQIESELAVGGAPMTATWKGARAPIRYSSNATDAWRELAKRVRRKNG